MLTKKKKVIIIKSKHKIFKENLIIDFDAISGVQIQYNEYYYYIIISNIAHQSNIGLSEIIDLFNKLEQLDMLMEHDETLLKIITIYTSNPSSFSTFEDGLVCGLTTNIPKTWEEIYKFNTEEILFQEGEGGILGRREIQKLFEYFAINNFQTEKYEKFTRIFIEENTLDILALYTLVKNTNIYINSKRDGQKIRTPAQQITSIESLEFALMGTESGTDSEFVNNDIIEYIDMYPIICC
jgi:hypothetical protein